MFAGNPVRLTLKSIGPWYT